MHATHVGEKTLLTADEFYANHGEIVDGADAQEKLKVKTICRKSNLTITTMKRNS